MIEVGEGGIGRWVQLDRRSGLLRVDCPFAARSLRGVVHERVEVTVRCGRLVDWVLGGTTRGPRAGPLSLCVIRCVPTVIVGCRMAALGHISGLVAGSFAWAAGVPAVSGR